MSLKAFHLFFIVSSLSLMAFIASWAGRQASAGNDHLPTLACAAVGFVGGTIYFVWFLRKYRKLK